MVNDPSMTATAFVLIFKVPVSLFSEMRKWYYKFVVTWTSMRCEMGTKHFLHTCSESEQITVWYLYFRCICFVQNGIMSLEIRVYMRLYSLTFSTLWQIHFLMIPGLVLVAYIARHTL